MPGRRGFGDNESLNLSKENFKRLDLDISQSEIPFCKHSRKSLNKFHGPGLIMDHGPELNKDYGPQLKKNHRPGFTVNHDYNKKKVLDQG